jgi:hypothetical protein
MEFLTHVTLLASLAVTTGVQVLKSKILPAWFNKHPVVTNIVLSIGATIWVLNNNGTTWVWQNWTDIVGTIATIAVVAAISYNQLLANWVGLKKTESEVK